MDTNINEVIFEKQFDLPFDLPDEINSPIMYQFLESGYFKNNGLCIDKFLDEDKTIDLEKLELALILTLEYLEFSVKVGEPIYIFLRNMTRYLELRGIDIQNLDRLTEESSFILGFCQAICDEESIEKATVVFEKE